MKKLDGLYQKFFFHWRKYKNLWFFRKKYITQIAFLRQLLSDMNFGYFIFVCHNVEYDLEKVFFGMLVKFMRIFISIRIGMGIEFFFRFPKIIGKGLVLFIEYLGLFSQY